MELYNLQAIKRNATLDQLLTMKGEMMVLNDLINQLNGLDKDSSIFKQAMSIEDYRVLFNNQKTYIKNYNIVKLACIEKGIANICPN